MPAKVPVDVNFVLHHDTAAHRGSLTKGDVRIGTAKASLTGTYQLEGPRAALNVKLNAPAMRCRSSRLFFRRSPSSCPRIFVAGGHA